MKASSVTEAGYIRMTTTERWIIGGLAFSLPALVACLGVWFDHSRFGRDQRYAALVGPVVGVSVVVAAVVPITLIFTTRHSMTQRILLASAVLCALIAECVIALFLAAIFTLR